MANPLMASIFIKLLIIKYFKMKISVALAAYNGERYILEQLQSIAVGLLPTDELIISIDPSVDNTLNIIEDFSKNKLFAIKIIRGPGLGVIKNFEHAIRHTTGDIVALADQDDIWHPDKIAAIREAFSDDILMMSHDGDIVDEKLNIIGSISEQYGVSNSFYKNIIKNSFIGCTLSFSGEFIRNSIPLPNVAMHDWFLALKAIKNGKIIRSNKKLISYRRHQNTATGREKTTLFTKLKWRFQIIFAVLFK